MQRHYREQEDRCCHQDCVDPKVSVSTTQNVEEIHNMVCYRYNTRDHPVAFHKAQDIGKTAKKLTVSGPVPDLEEAYDVRDIPGLIS